MFVKSMFQTQNFQMNMSKFKIKKKKCKSKVTEKQNKTKTSSMDKLTSQVGLGQSGCFSQLFLRLKLSLIITKILKEIKGCVENSFRKYFDLFSKIFS